MTSAVRVAVGVVIKGDKYFVCRRNAKQHQGNKWEFPGGKIEKQESVEDALARELYEEIGIHLTHTQHLLTIKHDYTDKRVELIVLLVKAFNGDAYGKEGQEAKWVNLEELNCLEFPEANKEIIAILNKFEGR